MRLSLAILGSLSLGGCVTYGHGASPVAEAAMNTTTVADVDAAGIVTVLNMDGDKAWGDCNGVRIAPRVVLTAGHCCEKPVIYVVPTPTDVKASRKMTWSEFAKTGKLAARCSTFAAHEGKSVKRIGELSGDVAIVETFDPLEDRIKIQTLLGKDKILKAPILNLDEFPTRKLGRLVGSDERVEIVQALPSGRFFGSSSRPMRVQSRIIGFDIERGIVAIAEVDRDVVNSGTSGAPVFTRDQGVRKLLGIISAVSDGPEGNVPLAMDVRSHQTWIEAWIATTKPGAGDAPKK